jgi:uncharacterized damage-inducible protein DinB
MKQNDAAAAPARIAHQLSRMYSGDAWHGPSVADALAGVTAEQAMARPIAGAHSIHELTHHIGAWVHEVLQRLEGRAPQDPDDGDWPAPRDSLSKAEWEALKTRVAARHAELARAIAAIDPARLSDIVGGERDAPAGTGMTYYDTLHGLIQHDAYHAGQIVLIKRALGI